MEQEHQGNQVTSFSQLTIQQKSLPGSIHIDNLLQMC